MLKDLSKRSNAPEILDDFQAGPKNLKSVFDDINRVNKILGGNSITINAVADLMEKNPRTSYVILDMGCGDGAMMRGVAQHCRRHNISASFIGVDLNKDVLEIAKKESMDFPEISFVQQDILKLDPSDYSCDILLSTLTMHHFTNEQLLIFVNKFTQLAKIGVVINDLQRSVWAYYLFKMFSLIFIKTKVAKIDGLISITKGFLKSDLISYAQKIPSVQHHIHWKWAFRYVWVMQPNRLNSI
ncbi:methyltransferase domain-containing protein [Costertonia aggregata]|uniref:Methyltransferase domain-containing protein n=1 Tax=Costertonia aggregata TaxID=343403 RepID=A0A7H9AU07_9FLAO|nr:methyltransferase domain-containing protein [Costertonia aggregata]QLG46958.1 methyltransferase domain-containing protein [Costertonia aggregata]